MTQQDTAGDLAGRGEPDHAGSTLARLLAGSPEVTRTYQAGCTELPEGGMSYGMSVVLADGRELLVDVQALGPEE
jgi:hypothetical protein